MDKIVAFFSDFKAGKYGFDFMKGWISDLRNSVIDDGDMSFFSSFISSIMNILPFVMIAAMLLFTFFGKKILPLCKFVFFFAFGFALGVVYIHYELISNIVDIPAWISGLVLAILAAILYRFLYILLFAGAAFYTVYTLCGTGFGDMLSSLGDLAPFVYMGVALVAVILAFVLRKYVEMLATAALGGYAISYLVGEYLLNNYESIAFLGGKEWIATLVIAVVVALPGFIVQVKTRKRY